MRRRILILTVLGLALPCLAAWGQFPQYRPGGGLLQNLPPKQETFEAAVEQARWRLGSLYLDPWIGLRNASYTNDIFGTGSSGSDFTATFGAGLRGYVPFGDNVYFSLHALPEYTAWADQTDRNRLNGRYGAGLFVFTNRITLDLTGTRVEQQRFFSDQALALVNSRSDSVAGRFDLLLAGSIYLFGVASETETSTLEEEELGDVFGQLDRTEQVLRGGLRWKPLERVSVGIGVEDSQVEFADGTLDRNNSGTAPVFEVRYQGPNFNAHLDLADRDLEPEPGSSFVPFSGLTGQLVIDILPERTLTPTLYASNDVVYALGTDFSHFENSRVGLRLDLGFGRRGRLRVFGEVGENDYTPLLGVDLERIDDISAWGVDLSFGIARWVTLQAGATQTEFDSNLDELDRDLFTYRFGLGLRFASGGVGWPP